MKIIKNDATHTSMRGHIYQVRRPNLLRMFSPDVYFWDVYCGKWRPSIVWKCDLIKLREGSTK